MRARLELAPGRTARLHLPVRATDRVTVTAAAPHAAPLRREVSIAQSEAPLLGAAVATDDAVQLEGFHAVKLDANALPRNAAAYGSIDALIVDTATLGALDERQLGALVAHAAQCGRVVLLNAEASLRQTLAGAGGCANRTLMHATSLPEARRMLDTSLASRLPAGIGLGGARELARPGDATWNRVVVIAAVYFTVAVLALLFSSSAPVFLGMTAFATVALFVVLRTLEPAPRLLVWGESASGERAAQYQAWQWFTGAERGHMRAALIPQLASAAPCNANQAMVIEVDPEGRATFAEFDTRLFRQTPVCYAGSLPVTRAITIETRNDGSMATRNAGTDGWPSGSLLAGRAVYDLPALQPGQSGVVVADSGRPVRTPVERAAAARGPSETGIALWPLDLTSLGGRAPVEATGWHRVSISRP